MMNLSRATDGELTAYRDNMVRAGQSCPEVTAGVIEEIDAEIRSRKAQKRYERVNEFGVWIALMIAWVIVAWLE